MEKKGRGGRWNIGGFSGRGMDGLTMKDFPRSPSLRYIDFQRHPTLNSTNHHASMLFSRLRLRILRLWRKGSEEDIKPYISPYKAKKSWPPDFSKMSEQQRFRLERRFRRRGKAVSLRPDWVNKVTLAQWVSCSGKSQYGMRRQNRC